MTDSCLICQTEPIESDDWFLNPITLEVICPWCVKDMVTVKELFGNNHSPDQCKLVPDAKVIITEESKGEDNA